MGRTSTAKERLVGAAEELMRGRGYGSLGVAEICARADVRKGSFYHFFASKQALTVAVVDAYWDAQRACWQGELGGGGPALDRLERLLAAMAGVQRRTKEESGAVEGCMLGNLALELSTQEPDVRARLEEVFDEQIRLVEAVLTDAAGEGSIPAGRATTEAAQAVISQLEGAVLLAKLKNDPAVLDALWPHTLLLLQAGERA
ncbi:TetR/AcrR family transcriptional regulator [Streptomyces sp. NPDC059452]|uniref:TetR/AcrR family transcriptional regulator n=1 Tax=Streptomyces sp. NPDC059452 TaxID=3346835 RepID=UPI00369D87D3